MILLNITAAMFCLLLIILFACVSTMLISTIFETIGDIRKEWHKK